MALIAVFVQNEEIHVEHAKHAHRAISDRLGRFWGAWSAILGEFRQFGPGVYRIHPFWVLHKRAHGWHNVNRGKPGPQVAQTDEQKRNELEQIAITGCDTSVWQEQGTGALTWMVKLAWN